MLNKLRAAVFCAAVIAAVGTPAEARRTTEKYTSLTVFGDSLVDAGNAFIASGGRAASPAGGYFMGRFTNGYDYTDLLSQSLFGTPTVASLAGGNNYGFGGARATTTSPQPDLIEQLAQFQGSGKSADANGLYVLTFGGNDVFAAQGGTPVGYSSTSAFSWMPQRRSLAAFRRSTTWALAISSLLTFQSPARCRSRPMVI